MTVLGRHSRHSSRSSSWRAKTISAAAGCALARATFTLRITRVLNTLDFGSCALGSGVTDALVEFLVTNTVLEELWINTNKIGTGGAQFFAGLADNKV